jgi:hypothetical protein
MPHLSAISRGGAELIATATLTVEVGALRPDFICRAPFTSRRGRGVLLSIRHTRRRW